MANKPDFPEFTKKADAAIRQAECLARRFYKLDLPQSIIDYSLRGRCAGQARIDRNGQTILRVNRQLLVNNLDDFLRTTIPHEVAHLVVNWQHRNRRQRPRPHGPEWQTVMQECFGLKPIRCHSYQTTPARVVPRAFRYICSCQEHHLTSIMHKKIRKAGGALCRRCKGPLRLDAQRT